MYMYMVREVFLDVFLLPKKIIPSSVCAMDIGRRCAMSFCLLVSSLIIYRIKVIDWQRVDYRVLIGRTCVVNLIIYFNKG